MGNHSGYS